MVICEYCGEEEATDKIANPNLNMGQEIDWNDENSWWDVCKTCEEVIPLQRMSGVPDKELQKHCKEKLSEIAKRTGKPIINASITVNYHLTS